jgi:Ala-tRNA(Pro) deacylase
MSIAPSVERFLQERGVSYDVVEHPRTYDAMFTAAMAHVPGDDVAKSVVLHDAGGGYVMAVLPSTRRVQLGALEEATHRHLELASEAEIARIFDDCEFGAVPPVGTAYGVPTVVDDSIVERDEVYFEAGDHMDLVHVSGPDFRRLIAEAEVARFAAHV